MKVGNYEIAAGARIDPFYFSLNGQNFAKYDTALRRDQDRLGLLPSHGKKKTLRVRSKHLISAGIRLYRYKRCWVERGPRMKSALAKRDDS
ncbi:unnamed protein product [Lasius platythorax]|uniref:Uncharacterized protein n=1 Tax=Lasius platythorax TaxID=488582 RepID=A0AAV2NBE8_9HYME